mgnify:CR=1 FL=1
MRVPAGTHRLTLRYLPNGFVYGAAVSAGTLAVSLVLLLRRRRSGSSDASPEARAHQLAFIEACGKACKEADLVHLLEILIYPLPGEATPMSPEQRTERAIAAVEDYLDPRFNVDIYKLEPPIPRHPAPQGELQLPLPGPHLLAQGWHVAAIGDNARSAAGSAVRIER